MSLEKIAARLQVDEAGTLESGVRPDPVVVVHYGPPVEIGCERGGRFHRGLSIHGDIDILPAGLASQWTLKQKDTAFVMRVPQDLMTRAATELGIHPEETGLLCRFQARDARLEHLAWALKADLDHGLPGGNLFSESVGLAIACQLLQGHRVASTPTARPQPMPPFRLRRVQSYIEDNLGSELTLAEIAAASGLSVSHCQRVFSLATGMSIHQYVIRRRVERAKWLLAARRDMPLSEVAHRTGFSHQSHLAQHMRRLLGESPAVLRAKTGKELVNGEKPCGEMVD